MKKCKYCEQNMKSIDGIIRRTCFESYCMEKK